jgi:hypothetical protein
LHFVSQPTPWVAGAIPGDGPLKIGSAVAWQLEKDGSAGMLEHSGAGIGAIKEVMEEKQRMMATLGAKLLEEQPGAAETATAVGMRHSGEQANLRTLAQVAEQGLTRALQQFVWWMGTEATPALVPARVELSKDFFAMRMSEAELRAYVMAWQSDGISWETLHYNLARGDVMRPGVSADDERRAIERQGGIRPPASGAEG